MLFIDLQRIIKPSHYWKKVYQGKSTILPLFDVFGANLVVYFVFFTYLRRGY